jgi:hypothetical protein
LHLEAQQCSRHQQPVNGTQYDGKNVNVHASDRPSNKKSASPVSSTRGL